MCKYYKWAQYGDLEGSRLQAICKFPKSLKNRLFMFLFLWMHVRTYLGYYSRKADPGVHRLESCTSMSSSIYSWAARKKHSRDGWTAPPGFRVSWLKEFRHLHWGRSNVQIHTTNYNQLRPCKVNFKFLVPFLVNIFLGKQKNISF
jgi:hypothetical protein